MREEQLLAVRTGDWAADDVVAIAAGTGAIFVFDTAASSAHRLVRSAPW
jgi:hypothetical protein